MIIFLLNDENKIPIVNRSLLTTVALISTTCTIYSTKHAWNEHPQLLLSSHIFCYNCYSSGNSLIDTMILSNLRVVPKETYEVVTESLKFENKEASSLTDFSSSNGSYSTIKSVDSVQTKFDKMQSKKKKEESNSNSNSKSTTEKINKALD